MKYIALVAVITILLLQFFGAIPQSSVGGPMTIAMVLFIAVLAVAIHEAWSRKLGVLGWIVSIIVALVGAYVAAEIGGIAMGAILVLIGFEGSLAESGGLLHYVALTGMMLFPLLGAWLALRLVDRMR
ncbi:MAG: hypothetical protein ACK4TP_10675 [Hyphomicrobium sp.]|jgi:hypothetical protein